MLVQELARQDSNPVLLDAAREQQGALARADQMLRRRDLATAATEYDAIAADCQEWLSRQAEVDQALDARSQAIVLRDEAVTLEVPPTSAARTTADAAFDAGERVFETHDFTQARQHWMDAASQYRSAIVDHLLERARVQAADPQLALHAKKCCEGILALVPQHAEALSLLDSVSDAIEYQNTYGMTFVLLPSNQFMMGTPNGQRGRRGDEIHHPVQLTSPFYMQVTEVTQAQWDAVMGYNPSASVGPRLPVENISWTMAQEFCQRLSQLTGQVYRLPTEAEWEYACRAGSRGPYSASSVDAVAWHRDNAGGRAHAVGELGPNDWGLHDMHGNVAEWCEDVPASYPGPGQIRTDPLGRPRHAPHAGTNRVIRGGAFGSNSGDVRSARRMHLQQGRTEPWLGFRVVLEATVTP